MTDRPRDQSRTGCGGALAWFLTVGLIRAIGQELGWSDRAQLIAVLMALVLVVIVSAARQQAATPERDRADRQRPALATDDPARQKLLERLDADMRQLMLIRALRDYQILACSRPAAVLQPRLGGCPRAISYSM